MLAKFKKNWLALASSVLFLAGFAYVLIGRTDLPRVAELISKIDMLEFALALGLLAFVGFWEAPRTSTIMSVDGDKGARLGTLYRIALIRQFVVHAAPISALADAAKAAMLTLRLGLPASRAASYVVYERIIGVLSVAILGIAALPLQAFLGVAPLLLAGQLAFWVAGLAVAGGFVWYSFAERPAGGKLIDRALRVAHGLGLQLKDVVGCCKQLAFMALQLSGVAAVFAVLAHAMHLPLTFFEVLAFVPIIYFFSSLPIFYAGWGGREAIFAATFGVYAGVAAADSFSVSVAYGLVVFTVSLPGAALWAMRPSMRKGLGKDVGPISHATQA